MTFKKWFETFVEEKNIDGEMIIDVEGPSGMNVMPLDVLFSAILATGKHEQQAIKAMIVKIDFCNGDVLDYFKHLAKAIAI